MSRRKTHASRSCAHSREAIAHQAARLIVEDGMTDWGLAKRKAAQSLGLGSTENLPDQAELERALHDYQTLFLGEEHSTRIFQLRQAALRMMKELVDFHPWLTGHVLDGTANQHQAIELVLYADSAKEVEIELLNRGIEFEYLRCNDEQAEVCLRLEWEFPDRYTPVHLMIYPAKEERFELRSNGSHARTRMRMEALERLLDTW